MFTAKRVGENCVRGIASIIKGRHGVRVTPSREARRRFLPGTDALEERALMSLGLDPTFGNGGVVGVGYPFQSGQSGFTSVSSSVLQPDGKLIVGASVAVYPASGGSANGDLLVKRLNVDGSLDSTFGAGGQELITVPISGTRADSNTPYLTLQSDGKIVVGATVSLPNSTGSDFVAARLNTNGTLDTSFNGSGIQTVNIGYSDWVSGVAVAPDGYIVLAGTTTVPTSQYEYSFALARLTPNGSLDGSFNAGAGTMVVNFSASALNGTTAISQSSDTLSGVAVQQDGKIVVVGQTSVTTSILNPPSSTTNVDFAVARIAKNGTLDSTFNGTGKLTIVFDLGGDKQDSANAVALQSDGKIVIAGYANESSQAYNSTTLTRTGLDKQDVALVRLSTGGALDTTFGTGGKVVSYLTAQGVSLSTEAKTLVIRPDGKILVGGVSGMFGGPSNALLAQYTTTGVLDTSFEKAGIALFPGYEVQGLAIDQNGKYVYLDGMTNSVTRTTAPSPAVVSVQYVPITTQVVKRKVIKLKTPKFNTITVHFNTGLHAALAGRKANYQIRNGSAGRRFVPIKSVTYNATTHDVTIKTNLNSVLLGKQFHQVIFSANGIFGADSQILNGGNDLAMTVSMPK